MGVVLKTCLMYKKIVKKNLWTSAILTWMITLIHNFFGLRNYNFLIQLDKLNLSSH